jgi:hypothetical protein
MGWKLTTFRGAPAPPIAGRTRLAGHVETGSDSVSDPALGA